MQSAINRKTLPSGANSKETKSILRASGSGNFGAGLCGGPAGIPLSEVPSLLRNSLPFVSVEVRNVSAAMFRHLSPRSVLQLFTLRPVACIECRGFGVCTCAKGAVV